MWRVEPRDLHFRSRLGGAGGASWQRTDFWSALAEDQHRHKRVLIPEQPVAVDLAHVDFAATVDALLENVLAHTSEGVAFDVHDGARVTARLDRSTAATCESP